MTFRRRAVDAAALVRVRMLGNDSRELSAASQNLRQQCFTADMHHHNYCGIKIFGQMLVQLAQSFHPPADGPMTMTLRLDIGKEPLLINSSHLKTREAAENDDET